MCIVRSIDIFCKYLIYLWLLWNNWEITGPFISIMSKLHIKCIVWQFFVHTHSIPPTRTRIFRQIFTSGSDDALKHAGASDVYESHTKGQHFKQQPVN